MRYNISDLYNPKFINEWKVYSLKELADWLNGRVFRKKDYSTAGHPVIKIAELNRGINSSTQYSDSGDIDSKYKLSKGTLLFSWSGNPKTSINSFIFENEKGWLNQHIYKVTPNDVIKKDYLYYILKYINPNFEMIASNKQTTGLGHITKKDLRKIKVRIPMLKEQKSIADTLSALDDKIEYNVKINKNLEKQAQAMFKYWFVDFEFPDENGNPYKSCGGEMVESELGMVPKGWEVGEINEYFKIGIGRTPPRKKHFYFSDNQEDMAWVSISDLGKSGVFISESKEKLTDQAFEDFNIRIIPRDSVLMSFKLTIGRIAITDKELTTNEAIAHFVNEEKDMIQYLYLYLKIFEFEKLGNTSSIGTAINSSIVKKIPFLNPDKKSLDSFNSIMDLIFKNIRNLEAQNKNLSQLRDTLLPKLMSGEIRIPLEVEI